MIAKLGADESKDMIYDNISQEMLDYDKPYKTNPIRLCVENKIVCVCVGGGGGGGENLISTGILSQKLQHSEIS